MARYLLCPQCGDRRFYVLLQEGTKSGCKVSLAGELLLGSDERIADASPFATAGLFCCGCSWRGGIRKLVKIFCG